ncbi:MAG: hypothetical protein GX861_00210 [Tenericutes bacterium]|jgi:hypothetical protein|nr:hypothetical protein [Mycoplasmatota bacterium]
MELIYLIIILMLVAFVFKSFNGFIYLIVIFDILFRILTFIKNNINLGEMNLIISKYFSPSIPAIIHKYTSGDLATILMWILVAIYLIFLALIIKYLWDRK